MNGNHQYELLHDRLKSDIIMGKYRVGDILPSENELSSKENLARSTVRNALAQLEKEGYIVKKRGKGSIVASTQRVLGILSYQGFSTAVGNSLTSTCSIQEPVISQWPDAIYGGVSEKDRKVGCISFSRVRYIEEEPAMWETSYLNNQDLPRFVERYRTKNSFFGFLAKNYAIEVTGMIQKIKAVASDKQSSKHLKIELGTPILLIFRKYTTNRLGLSIYSTLYCSTEKYAMGNETNTN